MGSVAEEESFPASDVDNPGTPIMSLKEESSHTLAEDQSLSMSQEEDVMDEMQETAMRSPVSPTKSNMTANENTRRDMHGTSVRIYTQFGTRGGAFSMAKPKSDVDIKMKVLM
jgi:hypothetical protein